MPNLVGVLGPQLGGEVRNDLLHLWIGIRGPVDLIIFVCGQGIKGHVADIVCPAYLGGRIHLLDGLGLLGADTRRHNSRLGLFGGQTVV